MYGTVARIRVKPGAEQRLADLARSYEDMRVPGFVGTVVYRLDADPQVHLMAVLFVDRATYRANADDPAQDARYRDMLELLEDEPEWQDGEVVHASGRIADATA